MPAGHFAELTEGQKACLRLVLNHHTSKEIGRILGISPFTVDQRLDAARHKLNADSRKEAAKMLAIFENGISESLVYQSPELENARDDDSRFRWKMPPLGGARHRLSAGEKLVQSLSIALFGTLIVAMIIIILTGMMGLLA